MRIGFLLGIASLEKETMTIRFFFAWYDFWIGFFWDRKTQSLYICPIPMIGAKITFDGKCLPWLHQWSGWIENLNPESTNERYRQCNRCSAIQLESHGHSSVFTLEN